MPPNVVMELKARKLYCNSDGHPPSDILYYDAAGNEVQSADGELILIICKLNLETQPKNIIRDITDK